MNAGLTDIPCDLKALVECCTGKDSEELKFSDKESVVAEFDVSIALDEVTGERSGNNIWDPMSCFCLTD